MNMSRVLSYLTAAALLIVVALVPVPAVHAEGAPHPDHRALSATVADVIALADWVRTTHPTGNYGDLAPAAVVGNTIWGPVVVFTGPLPDAPSTRVFGLNLNGIPSDDCQRFIASVAFHFTDIWAAGSGPADVGASVYTDGRLDVRKAAKACRAHALVGLDLITH